MESVLSGIIAQEFILIREFVHITVKCLGLARESVETTKKTQCV